MGKHPINLIFRFLLEIVGLFSFGLWGWQADQPFRWFLVVLLPIGVAVVWATLNIPDDPSRSGKAPVPVPGWLRLLLELLMFFGSAAIYYDVVAPLLGWIMVGAVIIHYAFSWDRVAWLLGADIVCYPERS